METGGLDSKSNFLSLIVEFGNRGFLHNPRLPTYSLILTLAHQKLDHSPQRPQP